MLRITYLMCLFAISARRGGPLGFAALRAPRPFLLAGGALAKRGLSMSYAAEAAILFPPTTLQEQALDGSGRKQN